MRALALAVSLLLSGAALAQGSDAPIPYDDDPGSSGRKLPERSEPARDRTRETDVEKQDRDVVLAGLDDPNIGLTFEALAGFMLLDSSKGNWVEARFSGGGRFTWEFGRLFSNEFLRPALFADLLYAYAQLHDGTAQIFGDTNYHYFAVAPAYEFPFSAGSPFGAFLQLGFGLGYEYAAIHNGNSETTIAGLKPLIQYGVGLRGGPRPTDNFPFRISFRIELTRFRRGYMDDTFIGGSVGVGF